MKTFHEVEIKKSSQADNEQWNVRLLENVAAGDGEDEETEPPDADPDLGAMETIPGYESVTFDSGQFTVFWCRSVL